MFHFSGCRVHNPMDSGYDDGPCRPSGYPIRISPGLSSLAALRGFSQLAASFFACRHQGIHHKPLSSSFRGTPVTRFEIFSRALLHLPVCFHSSLTSLRICFVCLILVCLYSWKLYSPQNCWSISFRLSQALRLMSVICATRMSICSPFSALPGEGIRLIGLEPMTPRLSSACSNQLSYSRVDVEGKGRDAHRRSALRGVDLNRIV